MNSPIDRPQKTGADLPQGSYIVGSATSVFSVSDLRLRVWPILATIGFAFLMFVPAGVTNLWAVRLAGSERLTAMPWIARYADHLVLLVAALLLIVLVSNGRIGEYGLRWPKGKSYTLAAIGWGACFGVLMTFIDYFPQILTRTTPADIP